ncbi:hypothetical protein L208DRAFT_1469706 [Tricholoma matsutake]|nr:hypothetical protein L208DRAFT_1469706 [Tricholoma matsutake 945]
MATVPLSQVSAQGQPLQVIAYAHFYNNNVSQQQEPSQPNNKSEPWEISTTGNCCLDDGPENSSLKLEWRDVNPLHDEVTATLVAAAHSDPSSLLSGEPNGYATFDLKALNALQATQEAVNQAVDSGWSSQSHRKPKKNRNPKHAMQGTTLEDVPQALDTALLQAEKVGGGGDGKEPDADLQGVYAQTHQNNGGQEIKIPLWESYMNPLKLLVSHFNAIDILHCHVNGTHFTGYSGVIIKVFPPPPITRHLLSWKDLLWSKDFPDSPKSGAGASASVKLSNEDIITFLEKLKEKGTLLQDAKCRLQKCGSDMGLFDGIIESLKRDLEELLGHVDIQAFILETVSDIKEISNLAKEACLLVKQYTIDWMMDSKSLSGLGNAVFSAGSKENDERGHLKVLLEKAMINARDTVLEFKMRTKESPDMGEFVQIIASLNNKLKKLAMDIHNEEFIKDICDGTHCISRAATAAKQSASSSVIIELTNALIPSYAATTFIANWERIIKECGFSGVEHLHNILAMLEKMGVDFMVHGVCFLLFCTL